MIPEQYCEFETCRLLKEVGFPQENGYKHAYVIKQPKFVDDDQVGLLTDGCMVGDYTAVVPTQEQALRWLREEKKVFVVAMPTGGQYAGIFDVAVLGLYDGVPGVITCPVCPEPGDYETAVETGILGACNHLISGGRA